MATIVYLDVDDEITSAAARIRSATDERIALVVPHGSRLATSRINFRLLAREAAARGRSLGIVAPDAATRALAASAELGVFSSVAEFEAGEAGPAAEATNEAAPPAPGAPAGGAAVAGSAPPSDAPGDLERTMVAAAIPAAVGPAAPTATPNRGTAASSTSTAAPATTPARTTKPGSEPVAADRTRVVALPAAWPPDLLRGRGLLAVIGIVAALVLVAGAVAAYLLLPSATITITPRIESVGPLPLTVVADPDASEVDAAAGVIPATRISVELEASDTFEATGERVEEEAATGQVTFSNLNPAGPNTIPSGSIVSTEGGVRFRTVASVTLPAAQIIVGIPITIQPTTANARIEAVDAGPAGNVPVNAITVVPEDEDSTLTQVRNRVATEGGRREEFPVVRAADVDAAVEQLSQSIQAEFDERLADPDLVPEGATLFPATAQLGDPVATPEPADLVGDEVGTFEMSMVATGTVIAVDPEPVEAIAEARITRGVAGGYDLIEGSVEIEVGEPAIEGGSVSYPVAARASRVRQVDAEALRERIRGLPVPQARSILDDFGEVDIAVWPDWVSSIPTIDDRVTLAIRPPASPEPSGSPGASGSPRPSGSGGAASPAPSPPSPARSPSSSPSSSPSGAP